MRSFSTVFVINTVTVRSFSTVFVINTARLGWTQVTATLTRVVFYSDGGIPLGELKGVFRGAKGSQGEVLFPPLRSPKNLSGGNIFGDDYRKLLL